MANLDRLSGLDASFLHLENDHAHMHIAACAIFAGRAPDHAELLGAVDDRLHLIPRYRQRLARIPCAQGRPVWVDDPHFNIAYHVRHTALPRPGGELELRRLAGRLISQALDRARPLWELWLVDGLSGDRFGLLLKTHHALVDGVSGVDIATVLFDSRVDPPPPTRDPEPWAAKPMPSSSQLLAEALLEHAGAPVHAGRRMCAAMRRPWPVVAGIGAAAARVASLPSTSLRPAPGSPFNVRIGPHRRVAWVRSELSRLRAVSREHDCTVNDVVLCAVAGALGRYMREHGIDTDGVALRVMVPVSVRSEDQRGALGNRLSAVWVPLPVGLLDPLERLASVREATRAIKADGHALSARALTGLAGFAPTALLSQAARLQAHQRLFNLVVTNVPGPQHPLYLLGRELEIVHPLLPLAVNTALGIAVISYNGRLSFGLTADFDALPDLDALTEALIVSIAELPVPAATAPGESQTQVAADLTERATRP